MKYDGLKIEDTGKNNVVQIEEGAIFRSSRIILTGNNNKIILSKTRAYERFVLIIKANNTHIEIQPSTEFIKNFKFTATRQSKQKLLIGKNFSCGGLEIQMNDGNETCTIGDGCLFSWGIKIRTSDGHSVIDMDDNKAINLPKDVYVHNRVWIGEDVKLLKGTVIQADSIVGSGAIVTKAFNEGNCVVAGSPAAIMRRNVKWDWQMPREYNKKQDEISNQK